MKLAYGFGNFSVKNDSRFLEVLNHVLPQISYLETADSYFYPASEKNLAKMTQNSTCGIITKVGGFKTNLPRNLNKFVVNNIGFQKYIKTRFATIGGFDPRITPKSILDRVKKSTDLFGRQIEIYLLHGVPNDFSNFVETMLEIKQSGQVKNVGISIDIYHNVPLDWADYVLGPLDLLLEIDVKSKKIIRNVYPKSIEEIRNQFTRDDVILTGTKNLDHFDCFVKALEK